MMRETTVQDSAKSLRAPSEELERTNIHMARLPARVRKSTRHVVGLRHVKVEVREVLGKITGTDSRQLSRD